MTVNYQVLHDALESITEARYQANGLPPKREIDPNAIERGLMRRLAPRQDADFWRSQSGREIDRVGQIAEELSLQADLARRAKGGYAVLIRARRKFVWDTTPHRIAKELNRKRLFEFGVTRGDVYHAQRRLGCNV